MSWDQASELTDECGGVQTRKGAWLSCVFPLGELKNFPKCRSFFEDEPHAPRRIRLRLKVDEGIDLAITTPSGSATH